MSRLTRFRPLALKALTLYGASAVNFILGFLFVPFALKKIGVEGYGLLSVYLFGVGYLLYVDLAISKVFVKIFKELGPDTSTASGAVQSGLLGLSLACLAIFGFVAIATIALDALGFADWKGQEKAFILLVAACLADYLFGLPITYFTSRAIASEKTLEYGRFLWCQNAVRFSVLFLAVSITTDPVTIASLVLIRRPVDYAITWLFFVGPIDRQRWMHPLSNIASPYFKANLPIIYAHVSHILAFETVSICSFLGFGVSGFGIYRASFDAINRIWFVTTIFPVLVFPRAVGSLDYFASSKPRNRLLFGLVASWLAYALIAVAFSLLGARMLVDFIPELKGSIRLLSWMFLGICANGHARLALEYLQGFGAAGFCTKLNIATLFALLCVIALLQRYIGINALGVAWATCFLVHALAVDWALLAKTGLAARMRSFYFSFQISCFAVNVYLLVSSFGW